MALIRLLTQLHHSFFSTLERLTSGWLLSLWARLTFLAVLVFYFWNSGNTKIGDTIFQIQDGAYFQILGESGMIAYDFDTANVPWYLDLMVYLGTISEFLLPLLIIIGLFTRISAIGMTIFILVQSYVDIYVHKVDAGTIGVLFDRDPNSLIMDQRALWILMLGILILKGAGKISLDHLIYNWWQRRTQ